MGGNAPSAAEISQPIFLPLTMFGMGMMLGWLLASRRRTAEPAAIAGVPATPLAGSWAHGALWSNVGATRISALGASANLDTAATLEAISAAQAAIDASVKEAYGDTYARAVATNSQELYQRASRINDQANAFDNYFDQTARRLAGPAVDRLKSLAERLVAEGKKIPQATATLTQVDAYLGILNQLIGLVN